MTSRRSSSALTLPGCTCSGAVPVSAEVTVQGHRPFCPLGQTLAELAESKTEGSHGG